MDVSSNLENASFEVVSSLPSLATLGRTVVLNSVLYIGDGTQFNSSTIRKVDSVDVADVTGSVEGMFNQIAVKTVACTGRPMHIVVGANSATLLNLFKVTGIALNAGLFFGRVGVTVLRGGVSIYEAYRNISAYSTAVSIGSNFVDIVLDSNILPTIIDTPPIGDNTYEMQVGFTPTYDPSSIVSGVSVIDCTLGMEFFEA